MAIDSVRVTCGGGWRRRRRAAAGLVLSMIALSAMAGCSFDAGGVGLAGNRIDGGPEGDPDGNSDGRRADAGIDEPPPPPLPDQAGLWLTLADGSRLLSQQPDIAVTALDGQRVTIEVDPDVRHQTMVGFGASLTESSAHVIATALPASQRTALLRRLFDPISGIGLRVLRQPIGATDFALGNYSYDDTGPDLADFSIGHDRQYVLPLLKEIRAINPGLVLMASPWSPPAWMKTSASMIGGVLRDDRQPQFAEYLARFVEAYAAEGVPVAAITLQNEPHYVPVGYPGMYMGTNQAASIIVDDLAPALAARGLHPDIFVWDHNWDEPWYPLELLGDPAVKAEVAGTAFHCYHGEPAGQSEVHDVHPDRAIWVTECSGGSWRGGFADSLHYDVRVLLIGAIRNWASAIIKWNLVLDDGAGPTNGGCLSCLGTATVDRSDGSIALEAEFYALGHLARFVQPGAQRVESTLIEDRLETVAFRNPDGSLVVLVINAGDDDERLQIAVGDRAVPVQLAAGAVATVTWGGRGALDRSQFTATASSSDGPRVASNVLDGDIATRWTSGINQRPEQWLAVDLGAERTFSAITLDAGASTGDYPRSYQVQISADGIAWSPALVSGSASSELFTIELAETTARHLRIRQMGAADRWWSVHELTLHR